MHVRLTTMQVDPGRLDDMVARFEEEDLPAFKELDGFKRFTLLVDRSSGKVVTASFWRTEEDMASSDEAVRASRERAAERGAAKEPPQVERFEVALDTGRR